MKEDLLKKEGLLMKEDLLMKEGLLSISLCLSYIYSKILETLLKSNSTNIVCNSIY